MKRIFLFAAILVSAVSCFKNTGWSESYTLRVTFEYPNEVYTSYFTADSLFFDKKGDGFSWGGTVLAYKYKVVDEQLKGVSRWNLTLHGARMHQPELMTARHMRCSMIILTII